MPADVLDELRRQPGGPGEAVTRSSGKVQRRRVRPAEPTNAAYQRVQHHVVVRGRPPERHEDLTGRRELLPGFVQIPADPDNVRLIRSPHVPFVDHGLSSRHRQPTL